MRAACDLVYIIIIIIIIKMSVQRYNDHSMCSLHVAVFINLNYTIVGNYYYNKHIN